MMEIGSKAPEVLGHDENGNEVRLSQFKGKKHKLATSEITTKS